MPLADGHQAVEGRHQDHAGSRTLGGHLDGNAAAQAAAEDVGSFRFQMIEPLQGVGDQRPLLGRSTFGVGQLLTAAVLYWNLENDTHNHAQEEE